MAVRNLKRNIRRTILSSLVILVSLYLTTFMRLLSLGAYDGLTDSFVKGYGGYIQVHENGFWKDKSINKLIDLNSQDFQSLKRLEGIKDIVPKLENSVLAASEEHSRGALIVGVDPKQEDELSNLKNKIIMGKFFDEGVGESGAIVAQDLANYLQLTINDEIAFLGAGYHGAIAAQKYKIVGIFEHPNIQFNRTLIYLPMKKAQELFSAPELASALVIDIERPKDMHKVTNVLKQKLDKDFEIMTWEEMQPEIKQMIESDQFFFFIMMGVLLLVVGFGIMGTILLMTLERTKEFCTLLAIGMKKSKMYVLVIYESILTGLFGILFGLIAAYFSTKYFHEKPLHLIGKMKEAIKSVGGNPVIVFPLDWRVLFNHSIILLLILIVASILPIFYLKGIKAIDRSR
jgi:ABC-type lipoprotein release transport system permease subunit